MSNQAEKSVSFHVRSIGELDLDGLEIDALVKRAEAGDHEAAVELKERASNGIGVS